MIIVGNYSLSFYGASVCTHSRMTPPLPIGGVHWCVPLGSCEKLLSSPPYQHDATSGLCRFLSICPSLPFAVRQGSKEGCSLYSSGFESPCYLTTSPPKPLPIYGGGAVNPYVRSVPNRLPSPFWQSLHYGNLRGVYGIFRTCAPHVYSAMRVHSAPQDQRSRAPASQGQGGGGAGHSGQCLRTDRRGGGGGGRGALTRKSALTSFIRSTRTISIVENR